MDFNSLPMPVWFSFAMSLTLGPCGCCGGGGQKLCSDYLLEHSFIEVLGLLFDKKGADLFDTIDLSLVI